MPFRSIVSSLRNYRKQTLVDNSKDLSAEGLDKLWTDLHSDDCFLRSSDMIVPPDWLRYGGEPLDIGEESLRRGIITSFEPSASYVLFCSGKLAHADARVNPPAALVTFLGDHGRIVNRGLSLFCKFEDDSTVRLSGVTRLISNCPCNILPAE